MGQVPRRREPEGPDRASPLGSRSCYGEVGESGRLRLAAHEVRRVGTPVVQLPPSPLAARFRAGRRRVRGPIRFPAVERELVIFDNDGVLVDSETLANRVLAELLTAAGYPTT